MANPLVELIAQNIETAVNEITAANGYNQDLTAVRPKRWDPFGDGGPDNGIVYIVQTDEEPMSDPDGPVGRKEWIQTFVLIAVVLDSDSATESIDTRINRVRADIQKKLMVDPTRGARAIDTYMGPSSIVNDGQGMSGVEVEMMVHYRVSYEDPYTSAL